MAPTSAGFGELNAARAAGRIRTLAAKYIAPHAFAKCHEVDRGEVATIGGSAYFFLLELHRQRCCSRMILTGRFCEWVIQILMIF
jgi:hypothetical protein